MKNAKLIFTVYSKIKNAKAYILYMELSFQQLKQKDVICVNDGKNLGKVCDVSLSFSKNEWLGVTVTGSKGFKFTNKHELFIPLSSIAKIGEDVILVKALEKQEKPAQDKCPPKDKCKPCKGARFDDDCDRRDLGEYE